MVFHWSLSDCNFPQVSRTLLSNLADLNNNNSQLVWMVSPRPPTSKSSYFFNNPLVTTKSPNHNWYYCHLHVPIIIIIIITIIMSCRQQGYPWSSLVTTPYYSLPLAGLQGYILCPHIAAVCKFELVVLLLLDHMWGSIGVHHLWTRPCLIIIILFTWKHIPVQTNDFYKIQMATSNNGWLVVWVLRRINL